MTEDEFLLQLKENWGISIVGIGSDFIKTEMVLDNPSFYNIHGIVYGGVLYQFADISAGITARILGLKSVTAQGNISYYSSVKGGKVTCLSTIEKQGSRLSFLKSVISSEEGITVAEAQFVFCSYENKGKE